MKKYYNMIVGLDLLLLSHSVIDYDYDYDTNFLNAEVRNRILVGILSEA